MATVKSVPKGARTIRNANQLRNTLMSPFSFNTHWINLSNDVQSEILMSLESLFSNLPPFGAAKEPVTTPKSRGGGRSSKTSQHGGRNHSIVKAARSLIVVGINQVTKSLEKGQLQAVVLGRPTASEAVLTDHLKVLSATRNTPVCVVQGLRERLRKPMNIHCVSAMGFKKSTQCPANLPQGIYQNIVDLVRRIQEVTPTVALPWLHTEEELMEKVGELKGLFPDGKIVVAPKVKPASAGGAKKRKLEEELEPSKRPNVDDELRSPFAIEKSAVSKTTAAAKAATPSKLHSVKYQTAQILQIMKGSKKVKKKAGRG